ncbi:MAG: ribosomal L7Ae/L30e/S12e/Gadd45 family protein [Clostridiales bacterium]
MIANEEKIYSLLGFAQKAGKIHSGEETVLSKVNKKSASLLIVVEDASEDTKNKMENAAERHGIPFLVFGTKGELGLSMGKSPRNAALIMDRGFAETLQKYIKI